MKTRLPLIVLMNIAGLALFFSWMLPANHGFWFPIDSGIFHYFNNLLVENRAFLWLVAITNNRAFDGFSLVAMGLLMLSYWLKQTPYGRRQIVIMGVVMLLTAVVLNQIGQRLPVQRHSPTLFFTDIHRVSELLNIPTKDASKDSFPGDHGMMLMIFCGFMLRYFGVRAFAISLVIFVVFSLPRMMIGAHWFTDIFVGSLSVILVGLPWVLLTPLSDKIITQLNYYLPGKNKQSPNIQ
ncbi:phosphatase PAP2 family protein [Atlantibacter subterranea]|jgi:Kdo2-lipid A phosphotransferase|uniref:Lipid A 1-diphosphate synthase n=1 Tax=Atlantibacter subterraneus TaxID=255519 RepID=A0ABU4DYE4_9ENTR|nr:phosphatase PAP2 family protein [Atlantibacter subterranea]MDV7021876.1 phosphatase PAP2 family protein [Atlantibacter subterranea]MDZ5664992.1 phosphatase PAP2 family protein [Atlantibacter hermannii]QFH70642.1 phosphatase PAP2 family protein [Enterobacter sp. E76]TSJ57935.1 phosphatase PAP2 family protein [Atlantibacter subterranea]